MKRCIVSIMLFLAAQAGVGMTLSSPANNTVLNEYNPELSWVENAYAEEIRIQLATDSSFSNIIADDIIYGFVNRFVPADDLDPDEYWWRIVAKNKVTKTWGSWTGAWKFTVEHNSVVNVSTNDSFSRIRTIIANAGNNVRILFEQGVYTFTTNDVGTVDYFIKLTNRENVVVDGSGSTIVFDGKQVNCGFFKAYGSTDSTVKNFKITRNYKMHLALEIKQVDAENGWFVCERINSDYPLPAEDTFQYEAGSGWVLDKDTEKIKFGTPLTLFLDTSSSGVHNTTQWKYYLAPGYTNYITNLSAGDIFIKDEKYGSSKVLEATWCENLTIYDIDTDNTGLTFQFFGEKNNNVKILRCDWLKDGYCGGVSDGIHFKDLRGGAWIEGNTIESNGDDAIAIRPKLRSFTRVDSSTVDVGLLDDVEVGDLLHFFEDDSAFKFVTEATITAVSNTGSKLQLTLSDSVITANLTDYCNFALAGPETMVKDNVIIGSRGDGFHLCLDGAVFEGNLVQDIGERTFTFTPSEGGGAYSRNVMVTNNIFNNLMRMDTTGTVGAFLMIKCGALTNRLHDGICFMGNCCYGYPSTAVQIQQAKNVYVKNNRFSSGEYHDLSDDDTEIILVEETDNIFIQNNVFIEHRNRSTSEYVSTTNATGWATDNPDFNDQFDVNLWVLSKINHSETGNVFLRGEGEPYRSLTKVRLTGSGTMSGNYSTDKCTFANVDVLGDCDLTVKVDDFNEPASTQFAKGGLMLRETTDSNSKLAMLAIREYNGSYSIQHLSRISTGGGLTADNTVSLSGFPVYLNLVRMDNTMVSSYSYDNVSWTALATNSIVMSDMILGGVAVTSQATGELSTLYTDELHIEYE